MPEQWSQSEALQNPGYVRERGNAKLPSSVSQQLVTENRPPSRRCALATEGAHFRKDA